MLGIFSTQLLSETAAWDMIVGAVRRFPLRFWGCRDLKSDRFRPETQGYGAEASPKERLSSGLEVLWSQSTATAPPAKRPRRATAQERHQHQFAQVSCLRAVARGLFTWR